MTVKELIEKLQKCDPNAIVFEECSDSVFYDVIQTSYVARDTGNVQTIVELCSSSGMVQYIC